MGMHIRLERHGAEATAHLAGRFDFAGRKGFQRMRDTLVQDHDVHLIVLDLASVTHLDSAALGMLLLLLEAAGQSGKQVVFRHPGATVRDIIAVTRLAPHLDA